MRHHEAVMAGDQERRRVPRADRNDRDAGMKGAEHGPEALRRLSARHDHIGCRPRQRNHSGVRQKRPAAPPGLQLVHGERQGDLDARRAAPRVLPRLQQDRLGQQSRAEFAVFRRARQGEPQPRGGRLRWRGRIEGKGLGGTAAGATRALERAAPPPPSAAASRRSVRRALPRPGRSRHRPVRRPTAAPRRSGARAPPRRRSRASPACRHGGNPRARGSA